MKLSKPDVRRALIRHHFTPCATPRELFDRLRSVQFDPIAPVGCNHDLVLQARLAGYQVGDWEKTAYQDRAIYDGWDKQASLVPFEGWPLRRLFHDWYRDRSERLFAEHPGAAETILEELRERGPLLAKECEFQEYRAQLKGSWNSPNVTKQILRALWHSGRVMTSGRRKGQHLYDLTERVVPQPLQDQPRLSMSEAIRELVLERHRAVGLLRPNAGPEIWSYNIDTPTRNAALKELIDLDELVPVEVEGVKANATPALLSLLDSPPLEPRTIFVGPLDQLVWDRKMIAHLFDFDYVWEIYIPEAKRRWGYYTLPVLYGDALVARAEFWSRAGTLELRRWHDEPGSQNPLFLADLERAIRDLMHYSRSSEVHADPSVNPIVRDIVAGITS